jgi:hypothetical protein
MHMGMCCNCRGIKSLSVGVEVVRLLRNLLFYPERHLSPPSGMTMSESRPPKRKRRCCQFSLRTLLLALSLLSLLLGWFSVKMLKQREAVSAIRSLGRTVAYRHQISSLRYLPQYSPPGPAWLRDLLADDIFDDVIDFFDDVVMVDMGHNNRITDSDLEHLEGLTSLVWLCLGYSQITDAGLEHLEGLTSLQWLKIHSNQITDAGLVHLKGLTSLQRLGLLNTQVTDEGVKKLQKALPNCRISHRHPP